ncbi:MAG TPA: ABATE domain-containing protein, partial [Vicinamibacteria bacterium]|nr:ABATE domain-containing protein [Vicinamibacteria bacterium]
ARLEAKVERFEPIAGRLALDFVNTVGWRDRSEPEERLASFDDLLSWSRAVGLVSRSERKRLAAQGRLRPSQARAVVERARVLREALHRLFARFAAGQKPARPDLDTLNDVLAQAPGRRRLRHQGRGFVWEASGSRSLESILWEVAWSAADLLIHEAPKSIKRCAGTGCGWLFLDTSRNRTRQWCSMSSCGNRAKAKRHYAKRRRAEWE